MSMQHDLAIHFAEKLHLLVQDTFLTCRHGGMGIADTGDMLVGVLLCEALAGFISLGSSEEAVVDATAASYRSIAKALEPELRKRRRSARSAKS